MPKRGPAGYATVQGILLNTVQNDVWLGSLYSSLFIKIKENKDKKTSLSLTKQ